MRKVIETQDKCNSLSILESSDWGVRNKRLAVSISGILEECLRDFLLDYNKVEDKVIILRYERDISLRKMINVSKIIKYEGVGIPDLASVGIVPKKGARVVIKETENAVVFGYDEKDMVIDFLLAELLEGFTKDYMSGIFGYEVYAGSGYTEMSRLLSGTTVDEVEDRKAFKESPSQYVKDNFPDLVEHYRRFRNALNSAATPTFVSKFSCEGVSQSVKGFYPIKYLAKDLKEFGTFVRDSSDSGMIGDKESSWSLSEFIKSKKNMGLNIYQITRTGKNAYIKSIVEKHLIGYKR